MSDIFVAPFANNDVKDWPGEHYAEMLRLLCRDWDGDGLFRVIGVESQAIRACDIVRRLDATRVVNDCGRLPWAQVVAGLKRARCVIGNDSGIPHLAAYLGAPTVCVFGGSHQRLEWRAMGHTVVTVSRAVGCSPCHLDHGGACVYDKACLRQIEPAVVAEQVLALLRQGEASARETAGVLT